LQELKVFDKRRLEKMKNTMLKCFCQLYHFKIEDKEEMLWKLQGLTRCILLFESNLDPFTPIKLDSNSFTKNFEKSVESLQKTFEKYSGKNIFDIMVKNWMEKGGKQKWIEISSDQGVEINLAEEFDGSLEYLTSYSNIDSYLIILNIADLLVQFKIIDKNFNFDKEEFERLTGNLEIFMILDFKMPSEINAI